MNKAYSYKKCKLSVGIKWLLTCTCTYMIRNV